MSETDPQVAAVIATAAPLLSVRSALLGILSQSQQPRLIAVFLTGQRDFKDDIFRDLPGDKLLIRCARSAKSSTEAYTFALRLAYAEAVDAFACINIRDIYRTNYLSSIMQLAGQQHVKPVAPPFYMNLTMQEWMPAGADIPSPFHFREGLGLTLDERSIGQRVGAPGTFLLNRASAGIVLSEAAKHPRYREGGYDQIWRQVLLSKGINATLHATESPVYVFVDQPPKPESSDPATDVLASFPLGLRKPDSAVPTRLQTGIARKTPKVSVIVPTYNEGDWLFHTIDSLHQMRTNATIEVLVVDDGCDDGSIDKMALFEDVRVVPTPHKKAGLIAAKNTGAASARGEYLCFIDSHMLVRDYWIDSLLSVVEPADSHIFCTCNITDVMHYGTETPLVDEQYGYVLSDWAFNVCWHHYGRGRFTDPYRVPLCPGGMSLMRRDRFEHLGGFATALRRWGSEDVELSLRNYCAGGATICDPRTHIYHYFKNSTNRKRSFAITFEQTAFNALFVARTYMSNQDYCKSRAALLEKASLKAVVEEIESGAFDSHTDSIRAVLKRPFQAWRDEFSVELRNFEAAAPAVQQPEHTGSG